MDPDQKLVYIQRILRGVALKIYKVFLLECKESGKDLAGDKWTIGELKGLSTEDLCTWDKSDGISYDRGVYLVMDKWVNFKKEIWFELGNFMWKNHRSIFQDHLLIDIVKPCSVGVLRYA